MKKLLVLAIFLFFVSFAYAQNITIKAIVDNCDISINISFEMEDKKITFKPVLSKKIKNFTLEYWIEDLDGYLIKKRINTSNLNKKYFTPEINEFVIKNILYYKCKNESYTVNASKYVNLKNDEEDNEIEINEEISENKISNEKIKNNKLTGDIIYESKNLANIKNAKYLFLILILTIISIFVWKRK